MQGKKDMHVIKRDDVTYTINIRSLSNKDSVSFPSGLDTLDDMDYLVICKNLLHEPPNLIVLEPKVVKKLIYEDRTDKPGYWFRPPVYNKYGMTLKKVFG